MEFWALAVDRKEYISGLLHSVILLLTWPQKKLKLAMLLFRHFQLPLRVPAFLPGDQGILSLLHPRMPLDSGPLGRHFEREFN